MSTPMSRLLLLLLALTPVGVHELALRGPPAPNEIVLATAAAGSTSHQRGEQLTALWSTQLHITTHLVPSAGSVPAAELIAMELADLALVPRDAVLPEGVSLVRDRVGGSSRLVASDALHPDLVERMARLSSDSGGPHADPAQIAAPATLHSGAVAAREPEPEGLAALTQLATRRWGALASVALILGLMLGLMLTRRRGS